jgi:PBP1b-binding outer membrane lipoprotein LpoB
MKTIISFIEKHYQKLAFIFILAIFFNTCSNPNKVVNKRIDRLSNKIDSLSGEIIILKNGSINAKDLQIEGLKTEKRMIQSTDRKILDVTRQAEIDRELKKLESK